MRYLLLSVLVVSLVGVLVIPDAYSDTHYNINEGTIVDYKVDSTCKIETSEHSRAEYESDNGGTGTWKYVDQKMMFDGVQLESVLKSHICDSNVIKTSMFKDAADIYPWDTVSTISAIVGKSSSSGTTSSATTPDLRSPGRARHQSRIRSWPSLPFRVGLWQSGGWSPDRTGDGRCAGVRVGGC